MATPERWRSRKLELRTVESGTLEPGTVVCLTCGSPQPGNFCGRCGEKRITAHDYSIVHFGENLLETLTHFDFRSLRAFRVLVAKPGLLTRDYLDGRRKGYVGPIQLFVILNVVFALLGANTFSTPLRVQEHDPPFPAMKRALVTDALSHRDIDRTEFARRFDETAGLQAKTWIFSMIPLFALCLTVLYGFRRYFFEHLVFATHFYAFTLMWMIVAVVALRLGLRAAGVSLTSQRFDGAVSLLILAGLVVYLFLALRGTYRDGAIAAAARSLVLVALYFPIILAYRFLLFFVTLKTMH